MTADPCQCSRYHLPCSRPADGDDLLCQPCRSEHGCMIAQVYGNSPEVIRLAHVEVAWTAVVEWREG